MHVLDTPIELEELEALTGNHSSANPGGDNGSHGGQNNGSQGNGNQFQKAAIPGDPTQRVPVVMMCESQPITAEGVKRVVLDSGDLAFAGTVETLEDAAALLAIKQPDILLIDKSLGIQNVLDWINQRKAANGHKTEYIVWGVSITEAEALRFLQVGAKGILRKTADVGTLLACLRSVAQGTTWMADSVFKEVARPERYGRSELTPREQQVLELVEQGMKNKEIAKELGIRPGTVKIHLKHIFEKTGVRGRYGLALTVMQQKGLVELAEAS